MRINKDWRWKTHQPLIHLMMNYFKPELVMELGMGIHSTPLFLNYDVKELICVENDPEWIEYMLEHFIFRKNQSVVFHDTPDLDKPTNSQHSANIRYYHMLSERMENNPCHPRLLFVDQYACLRLPSILVLGTQFDIILHHDCQLGSSLPYNTYFEQCKKDFNYFILKSFDSWTACMIRKSLVYDENQLRSDLIPYLRNFGKENDLDVHKIYLIKL